MSVNTKAIEQLYHALRRLDYMEAHALAKAAAEIGGAGLVPLLEHLAGLKHERAKKAGKAYITREDVARWRAEEFAAKVRRLKLTPAALRCETECSRTVRRLIEEYPDYEQQVAAYLETVAGPGTPTEVKKGKQS